MIKCLNMMCRLTVLLVFVLLVLVGTVSASNVICTIVDEKVLVEVILDDGAEVILPEEYSLLEIDGNHVSFISRDFLRKNRERIFIFPNVIDSTYDLKVYLPQNYILVDELVYPKGYDISSDGQSIILDWNNVDEEVIVFYEGVENFGFWFLVFGFGLVLLGFVFLVFEKRKFLRKLDKLKRKEKRKARISKEDLVSRNLFGNEKKIVEFLMAKKGKVCWTKELVREIGISKVMASRKVRSLVEKGLVERESFGRENRIRLIK